MKITIVGAPSSVIFDQALPLVVALKKLHPALEILCLYPNPGSIAGARPGWTPIQVLEELGATSAYPITPTRWLSWNRLTLPEGFPKFLAKASRLTYPYLFSMGRTSRAFVSLVLLILASLIQGRVARKILAVTQGTDCVIWDATMVAKNYMMEPLLHLFRGVPSYSIRHGMGVYSHKEAVDQSWDGPDGEISKMVTVFAMTLDDIADQESTTGVSTEQIKATGIYRHHPDWIQDFSSHAPEKNPTNGRDTLLVVSRGHGSRMPRDRMLRYLEDIKTSAERLNLRVIIKPHPKETDLSVHEEVFGSASKGDNWEISDSHLAILARRAVFAVCFFSGSCLDLTAYGVPTIERLDLVGLHEYDSPSATRDSTGAPILEFRQKGHVLGSSTSEEFFLQVEKVMRDRQKVMRDLEEAYSRQFISPPMSPAELARDMSESCLNFLDSQSGPSQQNKFGRGPGQ